jgi:hypothetical protein
MTSRSSVAQQQLLKQHLSGIDPPPQQPIGWKKNNYLQQLNFFLFEEEP